MFRLTGSTPTKASSAAVVNVNQYCLFKNAQRPPNRVKTAQVQIWKQSQVAFPFPTWLFTRQKRWCNSSFVFKSELKTVSSHCYVNDCCWWKSSGTDTEIRFTCLKSSHTASLSIIRNVDLQRLFNHNDTRTNWKKTNTLLMSLPCLDNICFTTANCIIHLVHTSIVFSWVSLSTYT